MKQKTIVDPKGRRITAAQYLARYRRLIRTEYDCQYSHFGCAAWEAGPCMNETLSNMELDYVEKADGTTYKKEA